MQQNSPPHMDRSPAARDFLHSPGSCGKPCWAALRVCPRGLVCWAPLYPSLERRKAQEFAQDSEARYVRVMSRGSLWDRGHAVASVGVCTGSDLRVDTIATCWLSLTALLTLSRLCFLGVEGRTDKAHQDALHRFYVVQ